MGFLARVLRFLLVTLAAAAPVFPINGGSSTAVVGSAILGSVTSNETRIGNYYNYWIKTQDGIWDLTRSDRAPVTCPKTIHCLGYRSPIRIEPSRSALIIIDMQNFFLHPALAPAATAGRAAVQPTVDLIKGFRNAGMRVLWTNWGLNSHDLLTLPPAFIDSWSSNSSDNPLQSFGSEMGVIDGIGAGRKLMRGSWNAQPYGVLNDMKNEGVANGTDFYFNKRLMSSHTDRLSGLWGAQTPLGLWLQENEITTLFFGGVNADQCVYGTLLDALYKGYDVVYVEDISATTSPSYATQMVEYNVNGMPDSFTPGGFLANSSDILAAL